MTAIFPFYHTLTGNLMGRIRCPADGPGCAQLAKAGYLYDLVGVLSENGRYSTLSA
jgi:hypothetical protein